MTNEKKSFFLRKKVVGVFVSPKDYMLMANECEQLSCEICGHEYKVWCKKDKVEQVNSIVEKIKPLIAKTASNNQTLSFEKILFMAMIEILVKDKNLQFTKTNEIETIESQSDFDRKLSEEREALINDFISILEKIKDALC